MCTLSKRFLLIAFQLLLCGMIYSQITVINMIPKNRSVDTARDAEPNLSVNPVNPKIIVASAFTPEPMLGKTTAPIFISEDGGLTWSLLSIIPGANPVKKHLSDITVRFSGSGKHLYAATLRGDEPTGDPIFGKLNVLRISDLLGANSVDIIKDRANTDQPYIEATTVIGGSQRGKDKVYVANNGNFGIKSISTMDFFENADMLNTVKTETIERHANADFNRGNEPAVRTAIHSSGVAYSVFYRIIDLNIVPGTDRVSVIVVKDENWGSAAPMFNVLKDLDGIKIGRVVEENRELTWDGVLARNRLTGSNLSIAVDPTNRDVVYVAWADKVGSVNTLHVKKSIDGGLTWESIPGLPAMPNAINPALAVNNKGRVGFLYQQVNDTVGTTDSTRWVTHIKRSVAGDNPWDDKILANTKWRCTILDKSCPPTDGEHNTLGDYINLLAIGKDFYGIFSASNYPDIRNFPQSVKFQRESDLDIAKKLWTDDTRTTETKVSIDPYFFHISELPSRKDLYVRDFTNSFLDFDNGIEPSIDPRFCIYSDVWNRRSDIPGGFNANNQPQSEDPWQSNDGTNYAFARVHRNASIEATAVKLRFLYSEFGTGSNYVLASTAPSPTIFFAPADMEKTMSSGYKWILPTSSSTHTCLAVEISTQEDPTINSLLGHAPGWSTGTDLMVINDNNKAQRNMGVFRVPESAETTTASTGTSTTEADNPLFNSASIFAVIHNPGLQKTDMHLKMAIDKKQENLPSISVIGGKEGSFKIDSNKNVILRNMKPGESRHIRINYVNKKSKKGQNVPLTFYQLENEVVVNGFTVMHEYDELGKAINSNLSYEASIIRRVQDLYKFIGTGKLVKITDDSVGNTNETQQNYFNHLQKNLPYLKSVIDHLVSLQKNDVFELLPIYNILLQQATKKDGSRAAIAHLSLLNTIDACLTNLQLQKGNPADILQTIYLQRSIFLKVHRSGKTDFTARLIELSDNFIKNYESRKISNNEYPDAVKAMVTDLRNCVMKKANSDASLLALLDQVNGKYNGAIELQGHHINFLNALQEFLKL